MIQFLLEVVVFVAILAWLGAGVWFLSGSLAASLQLAALIGLMLALGYALDKIIPDPYPQRRQQPPKAPPTVPRTSDKVSLCQSGKTRSGFRAYRTPRKRSLDGRKAHEL